MRAISLTLSTIIVIIMLLATLLAVIFFFSGGFGSTGDAVSQIADSAISDIDTDKMKPSTWICPSGEWKICEKEGAEYSGGDPDIEGECIDTTYYSSDDCQSALANINVEALDCACQK